MRVTCTEAEKNIISQSVDDMFPVAGHGGSQVTEIFAESSDFTINGGTVIDCTWDAGKANVVLVFAEDDFSDKLTQPCAIKYPVGKYIDMKAGERLLVVHFSNGVFFPMKLNSLTAHLVPANPPASFSETDWSEAIVLPHPDAIWLEEKSSPMTAEDKAQLVAKQHGKGKLRLRDKAVIAMVGVMWFCLLALGYIALVAGEILTDAVMGLVALVLVVLLTIVGTVVFAKVLIGTRVRPLKSVRYQKRVLFHSMEFKLDEMGKRTELRVYENINGSLTLVSYPVGFNKFTAKDIYYGQALWKCSKDAVSCAQDINYFY